MRVPTRKVLHTRALIAAVAAIPIISSAQSAMPVADPLDSRASVPATTFRSAFADYRGVRDEPVGDWRDSNSLVGKRGGWRTYARELQSGGSDVPLDRVDNREHHQPAKNR